jgi:hypothetical protein
MLKELKFVMGSVARKDYVPELQHFKISDGRVEGFNGIISLSTPIDLEIEAMPKAVQFVKAIERLPDDQECVLDLTKAGRLSVKSGRFRAYVECWEAEHETPHVTPKGEQYAMPGGILPILKRVAPFMGIDASRPWACGILLDGQTATVTNNVVVVQHWLPGLTFPSPINLPSVAVSEMLRIGQEPVAMQPEAGAITFHYANGAWLRTSLLDGAWPVDLSNVLDRESLGQQTLPAGFFDAVARVDAFGKDGRIYLRPDLVTTSLTEGDGAQMDVPGLNADGCFHIEQIVALGSLGVSSIDWHMYPLPCLFYGDNLRGALVGIRQ